MSCVIRILPRGIHFHVNLLRGFPADRALTAYFWSLYIFDRFNCSRFIIKSFLLIVFNYSRLIISRFIISYFIINRFYLLL